MHTVALIQCPAYSHELVKSKIIEGLQLIGFDLNEFKNKQVVLKPNLLTASPPEKGVITHPVFFQAVARIVKDSGGIPIVAESPATRPLEKVLASANYMDIIEQEKIQIAQVNQTDVVMVEKPLKYKRFEISKAYFEADIIVSLPKLKTHSLTYMTGAVKNFLGVIPGLNKSQWHLKAPTAEEFSDLLLDLNEVLYSGFDPPKQFLHIMDGITGLEGEGPGPSGKPRDIGAILVSRDAIALDFTAADIIGMDYREVHTITKGFERSFGVSSAEDVSVVGSDPDDVRVSDFKPARKKNLWNRLLRGPFLTRIFKNSFTEKPVPSEPLCTLCYQCKKICPAGAIGNREGSKKVPSYDYDKCIRCFCCMEICPEAAIKLKKGRLQWLLGV